MGAVGFIFLMCEIAVRVGIGIEIDVVFVLKREEGMNLIEVMFLEL